MTSSSSVSGARVAENVETRIVHDWKNLFFRRNKTFCMTFELLEVLAFFESCSGSWAREKFPRVFSTLLNLYFIWENFRKLDDVACITFLLQQLQLSNYLCY